MIVKLEGKVAVVTGGARGQGANHCKSMAREGADIVILDICRDIAPFYPLASENDLHATVSECKALGVNATGLVVDVRDSSQVKDAIDQAMQEYGRIDILVNNAGVSKSVAVDAATDEVLDGIIDVNVKGSFNVMRFVAPIMKAASYGKVINVASAAAVRPKPYISHYVAAKGALYAVTKSWAREFGEWNITVNAIAPSTVYTDMVIGMARELGKDPDTAFADFSAGSVFPGERGWVTIQDSSAAVVFLASEESRMVTGHCLLVDAGAAL